MNRRIKAAWVKALRSGEYEQGYHRLRHNDTFCCLGVLCDILKSEINGKWVQCVEPSKDYWHNRRDWYYRIDDSETTIGGELPERIAKHVGLPTDNLTVMFLPHLSLADLNDAQTPFEKIADVIEEKL
jgi:hypothetical protein